MALAPRASQPQEDFLVKPNHLDSQAPLGKVQLLEARHSSSLKVDSLVDFSAHRRKQQLHLAKVYKVWANKANLEVYLEPAHKALSVNLSSNQMHLDKILLLAVRVDSTPLPRLQSQHSLANNQVHQHLVNQRMLLALVQAAELEVFSKTHSSLSKLARSARANQLLALQKRHFSAHPNNSQAPQASVKLPQEQVSSDRPPASNLLCKAKQALELNPEVWDSGSRNRPSLVDKLWVSSRPLRVSTRKLKNTSRKSHHFRHLTKSLLRLSRIKKWRKLRQIWPCNPSEVCHSSSKLALRC